MVTQVLRRVVAFLLNALIVPVTFLAIGSLPLFERQFEGNGSHVMLLHPGVETNAFTLFVLPTIASLCLVAILVSVFWLAKCAREDTELGRRQELWDCWRPLLGPFEGEFWSRCISRVVVVGQIVSSPCSLATILLSCRTGGFIFVCSFSCVVQMFKRILQVVSYLFLVQYLGGVGIPAAVFAIELVALLILVLTKPFPVGKVRCLSFPEPPSRRFFLCFPSCALFFPWT